MKQVEIFRNFVDMEVTYAELLGAAVTITSKPNYYLIRVEEVGSGKAYSDLYVYNREKDEIVQHEEV